MRYQMKLNDLKSTRYNYGSNAARQVKIAIYKWLSGTQYTGTVQQEVFGDGCVLLSAGWV
jgi:hypothetical protein